MQLIEFQQNIFKGKYPTKGTIGVLSALARIRKSFANDTTKLNKVKEEFEEFKKT